MSGAAMHGVLPRRTARAGGYRGPGGPYVVQPRDPGRSPAAGTDLFFQSWTNTVTVVLSVWAIEPAEMWLRYYYFSCCRCEVLSTPLPT